MEGIQNLLLLVIEEGETGLWFLRFYNLKGQKLKIYVIHATALAMTEGGTEISRFRIVTIAGCHLLQFQFFSRRFVTAGQDAEHQEEQG